MNRKIVKTSVSLSGAHKRKAALNQTVTEASLERIRAKIETIAQGDSKYASELAGQIDGMLQRDALPTLEAIFDLVISGKLMDSGSRREGRVIWIKVPQLQ